MFGLMPPVALFRAVHVESVKNVKKLRDAAMGGKSYVPVEVVATHQSGALSQVRLVGKTRGTTTLIVPSAFIITRRKSRAPMTKETCTFCGLSPLDYTTEEYMDLVHAQPTRSEAGYVDMQESRIADKSDDIWTAGLATCTALHFHYGDKQYLAHVSAPGPGSDETSTVTSHTDDVIKDIREAPTKITHLKNVTLYVGIGGNKGDQSTIMVPAEISRKLAWTVLDKIRRETGVRLRQVTVTPTCYKENVPRLPGNLTTVVESPDMAEVNENT